VAVREPGEGGTHLDSLPRTAGAGRGSATAARCLPAACLTSSDQGGSLGGTGDHPTGLRLPLRQGRMTPWSCSPADPSSCSYPTRNPRDDPHRCRESQICSCTPDRRRAGPSRRAGRMLLYRVKRLLERMAQGVVERAASSSSSRVKDPARERQPRCAHRDTAPHLAGGRSPRRHRAAAFRLPGFPGLGPWPRVS